MLETPQDPNRVLAALAKRGLSLELSTLDLCFIAALHVRANGEVLASFPESELLRAFEDVAATLSPGAENLRRRATLAIQRLRDQHLLSRVDGAGVLRSGEYSLTRLATGIVEFFLQEEALTRESLTLLTRTLLASLSALREAASNARTSEAWHTDVAAPLSVTVLDLVAGIERRQRGLDVQQEEFQREIASLLNSDWFGAVDRCQTLLESTARTLRELNEILLRDTHDLSANLQEIQELAVRAGSEEAEGACRRVADQVDRIAAWGSSRQRAWSEYYQYVHHFLRDVVRLDPTRALTQRLRDQLSGRRGQRFALTVTQSPPMRVPRDVKPVVAPPPVKRPRAERERPPEPSEAGDAEAALSERIREELAQGVTDLSDLTERITRDLPREERFAVAGRVVPIVAKLARPSVLRERPWVETGEDLVIEEWTLGRTGEQS